MLSKKEDKYTFFFIKMLSLQMFNLMNNQRIMTLSIHFLSLIQIIKITPILFNILPILHHHQSKKLSLTFAKVIVVLHQYLLP